MILWTIVTWNAVRYETRYENGNVKGWFECFRYEGTFGYEGTLTTTIFIIRKFIQAKYHLLVLEKLVCLRAGPVLTPRTRKYSLPEHLNTPIIIEV